MAEFILKSILPGYCKYYSHVLNAGSCLEILEVKSCKYALTETKSYFDFEIGVVSSCTQGLKFIFNKALTYYLFPIPIS